MGAAASLSQTEITVAPGAEVSIELRVRNTGAVVDQFTFTPIGTSAGWIAIEPPQVSLFPGAEETINVTFRPPRVSTTLAGDSPFAIKVTSREDPDGSAVEEGVVSVEAFDERSVELNPRAARGRRGGTFELALDNRGNTKAAGRLVGNDPDGLLTFDFDPPSIQTDPGTVGFARVKVRTRHGFWRGPAQTRQFQVLVEADDRDTLAADGALLQEQIIPGWLGKAVAALVLLLAFALGWYQFFLKPRIDSAATAAAKSTSKNLETRVGQALAPLGVTIPSSTEKPTASTTSTTAAAGASTTTVTTIPEGGGSTSTQGPPLDFRLAVTANPGAGNSQSFAIPAGRTYSMTDLVLQNPNGDAGRVRIVRDSDILFELALENFRDYDLHFIAPYVFSSGQNVTLQLTCITPGVGSTQCATAASFSGFLKG